MKLSCISNLSFVIDLRVRRKIFEYFIKKQFMAAESGRLDENRLIYVFC